VVFDRGEDMVWRTSREHRTSGPPREMFHDSRSFSRPSAIPGLAAISPRFPKGAGRSRRGRTFFAFDADNDNLRRMAESKIVVRTGESVLEVEEPDLVIYRLIGHVDGPDIRALRKAEGEWNVGKPYLLVLVDISQHHVTTMAARKASVEPGTGTRIRALAVSGGTRHLRVIVELALRGIRMIRKPTTEMRFFDDEPSAREWLHAQRPMLAEKASSGTP